jgi:two-component system response regulator YesN
MNIMIVDDEPIIRIGLRTLIDWDLHGLTLIGEASDGEEALEFMNKHRVDILVTDIRMPRMDGLELIRRAKLRQEDIGVLVLSCLDDFSYVKEAMKLGARDYILKPTMEPEELIKILNHIGDQLNNERKRDEHIRQLNIQLAQSKPYQFEARIRKCLELGIVDEHLEQELFNERTSLYSMLIYSDATDALTSLVNLSQSKFLVAIEMNPNERLVLIEYNHLTATRDFSQESTSLAEHFLSVMTLVDDPNPKGKVVCIGAPMERLDQLKKRMDLHRSQMHYRYYADSSLQIVVQSSNTISTDVSFALEIRNDILKSVMGNNRDGVMHHTQRLASVLANNKPDLLRLQAFIFETIGLIIGYARDKNYVGIEQYEQQYLSLERIRSFFHIHSLMEWMQEAVFEYWNCASMDTSLPVSNHPFIRKAKEYMRLNYQKSIGTTDIAEHVRLSRSYLSDLYSREVGESLIETLTRIRIEEACKRLRTADQKIYEIAEEVGFTDSKTFARTFRRIVGCSPKEYEGSNK